MVDQGTGRRRSRGVPGAVVLVLALGLSGCGGEGVRLPSVSRSGDAVVLPSATITIPDLSRSPSVEATPGPTSEPGAPSEPSTAEPPIQTPEPTGEPTPTDRPPSATVTATPTPPETVTATPAPTPTPTETVAPTEAPTPTETPSPTPTSTDLADASTGTDSGVAPWVWWLVVVALLAVALAVLLARRARTRREWAGDLAAQEAEVAWFARDLLPRLARTTTPDGLAGGWEVGAGRVTALEDRLTGLESTAVDDAGRARAHQLRDAVRVARVGVEQLVAARDPRSPAGELAGLAAQLETALAQRAHTDPA